MTDLVDYLVGIELALVSSPAVVEYHILRSWTNTDDGYLRIRATLVNGDFLEAAEYFVLNEGKIETVDYRHQWMDGEKSTLRRRWDSTPDHPHLQNFPHHVHVGAEGAVLPSHPMGILELLRYLETEFSQR